MRILFLSHRLPYAPNRGDRIRAYHLLREMSRFAEVSLLSLVHDDEEMSHGTQVPFATEVRCCRVSRLRNLARGLARLPGPRPLTHSLLDASTVSRALGELIARRPPDLVLAFCSGMARFAFEPPLDGQPVVLDMVDVDSVKWDRLADISRGPFRWIYRREARTLRAFEAAAVARARVTFVVSDRERLALQAIAPQAQVVVVPAGVELEAYRSPDPPVDAATVIFCGVMNYEPNVRGVSWFAAEVWPRVRSVLPAARFLIVGSEPTRAVKQLASRDPSIDVVGRVPSVQPYLWKSAISVAPLHVALGVQTKVLEALAAGLPVVVTPAVLNGLPPVAQRRCLTASDPAAFAQGVIHLLQLSPDERRQRAGAASLDSLRWSEQLRDLEGLLRAASNLDGRQYDPAVGLV